MTFQEGLTLMLQVDGSSKEHSVGSRNIGSVWRSWRVNQKNAEENKTLGMLVWFLCECYDSVIDKITEKKYFSLLTEMAMNAHEHNLQSMIVTPNLGQPNITDKNPLHAALMTKNPKIINIVLKYTPEEGVNHNFGGEQNKKFYIKLAIDLKLDKSVIEALIKKTTSDDSLQEAKKRTSSSNSWGGFTDPDASLTINDLKALDEIINARIRQVKSGKSVVSKLTGLLSKVSIFGRKNQASKAAPANPANA